ncbi:response regulator, partial [Vibrio parahaemolyticus V-223/04]
TARGTFDALS